VDGLGSPRNVPRLETKNTIPSPATPAVAIANDSTTTSSPDEPPQHRDARHYEDFFVVWGTASFTAGERDL